MRLAHHHDRAVLVLEHGDHPRGIDVATASGGRFGPAIAGIYPRWEEFRAWAEELLAGSPAADVDLDVDLLGAPSPEPRQVFAIGLNYADHADETGYEPPTELPPVFTKFPTSITGPRGEIALPPGGNTDWEVEVVAVIGRPVHRASVEEAWDHVAGLTLGQDLSERARQMSGPAPQFGLAKSHPGFSPMGPWLVTTDELADRDDIALGCAIDGETVQDGRTSKLLYSIPRIISALSEVVSLLPGDVIFTGTPEGVGMGMQPPRYLRSGEVLRTWADGLGEMVHTMR
ncbi:fumarylacetoacetate hydrolase family protein [Nocardioides sp. cx-169]|uniref:fumarylacetoacetate hydrolase family protein n=1 Tax=Nocardioides sp. cx-169 TaxID=2899080 RepID=UPI001E37EFF0|nr:fumarylacetoacetate hydrolase family protein [Nocardioides sp. cx-169]MCD4534332.1 fumarylacetoacetate hydrolase family protein [Nocardioides sp. cx-169]